METATAIRTADPSANMLNDLSAFISGLKNDPFRITRKDAKENFEKLGFPTTRHEEWKYTNVLPLLEKNLRQAATPESIPSDSETIPGLDLSGGIVLLMVNGFLQPIPGGLPEGLTIKNIKEAVSDPMFIKHFDKYADKKDDAFAALNTAFVNEGIYIEVASGRKIDQPVYIINHTSVAEDSWTNNRVLIVSRKNSQASIEWLTTSSGRGKSSSLMNAVTEIVVEENARLDFCILQNDLDNVSQVCNTYVNQERDSHFNINTITMGGLLVKNKLHLMLADQNIETHLFGLYMGSGKQLIDNHTAVFHAKPNCFSNQRYKGILDDDSQGVFNGKIFVFQDAQKTNAYQSNKNILLSDGATMNAKPQLEIFADDVKCSHGATTGQLDEEALFYLRSRGIGLENAKALLNVAFAADVIQNIPNEVLREYILNLIQNKLVKEA